VGGVRVVVGVRITVGVGEIVPVVNVGDEEAGVGIKSAGDCVSVAAGISGT
jgi:hypothetical protein